MASGVRRQVERVDAFQRGHAGLAFPLAVAKKFSDDKAGHLAALVAYYAFFSLFPLLMVLTAVLGMLLRNNPELQSQILDSALTQFPVIGDQIRENVGSITGNGPALVVGILTALWAGTGVTNALQSALNQVWDVPIKRQPNFLIARLRSVAMLAVLGVLTIAAALLSGMGGDPGAAGMVLRVVGLGGGIALNLLLFLLAFRILPNRRLSWAEVFPGAAVAAVGWFLLQLVGSWYLDRQLKGATETYGAFAFVIGLLIWLYLGAQLMLYAAEVNAVRVNRLWPRGLTEPMTEADRRALRRMARVEERREDENVEVEFRPEDAGAAKPGTKGAKAGPVDDGQAEGEPPPEPDARAAADRARAALEEARQAIGEAKRALREED